jgi:cell division inhibitor SepF
MSFWDEIKNFTKPYNDDEEYDDYDDEMDEAFEEPAPERERTPRFGRREAAPAAQESAFTPSSVNTTPFTPATGNGFNGQVVSSNKIQMILVRPESFNDAPTIAANMRAKKAVVLNLEGVEKNLARRIVDFLSGCGYALDGSVKKVSQATYVFCPHNMEVLGDLKNLQGEVENYV